MSEYSDSEVYEIRRDRDECLDPESDESVVFDNSKVLEPDCDDGVYGRRFLG